MNSLQEKIYGALGVLIIPPVVGSFVFLKEEATISVRDCETLQGRRGSSERIITEAGEELQLWPQFLGGPKTDEALEKLCGEGRADVTIRGARIKALPFWQRVIFAVR